MPEWNGKWHPFAERFPMLSEQELRDMADSIRETGQLVPCVMNSDGLGIDGRNRVAACRIAGVEPAWVVNDGNPMSVIVGANVHHRFLSTGQKAMAVAVDLANKGMRQNGRWKRGSVPDAPDNVKSYANWQQATKIAGVILDQLPDLADEVLSGALALDAAFQQAKAERDRRDGEADAEDKRRKRIAALPDDLAALVDGGVRDLEDAEKESAARAVVAEVDTIRDGDGAPPPSFGDRVHDGALSWLEAQQLAEEWARERGESIGRDQERMIKVTDGWATLADIAANPTNPYATAVLNGLQPGRREAIDQIIGQLNGAQQ